MGWCATIAMMAVCHFDYAFVDVSVAVTDKITLNMFPAWLPVCHFHLRRWWRIYPFAFASLMASGTLLAFFLAVYVQQLHAADAADQDWRALRAHSQEGARSDVSGRAARPVMASFNNTLLVEALNRVAEQSKLSFEEVSFVLDQNATQPYLRYHATLTVSAGYPAIRKFLDQVRVDQPGVSLDTITCTRDDISTVELTCALALSAFYRKDGHG